MRTPELIATHTNTDFDAFAAMVAAHKLYPEAQISLGGAVNRNVREFQALYADAIPVVDPTDVDRDSVRRLILVDTVHANRLGDLGDLCGREGVQVVAFDHHAHPDDLPDYLDPDALVSSDDGSLVTLLVRIIAERGIPVTPFEATVFALGIHEDTGSLTFATTTTRDAEALAYCMRAGADTELLERWLTNALTPAQRVTLAGALQTARELPIVQASVLLSALHEDLYVEGVSVVAHRVMDLTGCDAYFLLVEMEGRVFVTARSRGGRVDVAEALRAVGGGGHTAAASAVVKDRSLDEVAAAVAAAAPAAVAPTRVALDALEPGPPDDRGHHARRRGRAALPPRRPRRAGRAPRRPARRARRARRPRARLGPRPRSRAGQGRDDDARAAGRGRRPRSSAWPLRLAQDEVGWLPVVADEPGASEDEGVALGQPARRRHAALGGRRAAARARRARDRQPRRAARGARPGRPASGTSRPWPPACAAATWSAAPCATCCSASPASTSTSPSRATASPSPPSWPARLKGHVRPHQKFGTAVVVAHDGAKRLRVDVASTRAESYEYPGALPKVEHAGIRSDLARRDFTINAMAVSLKPETFGDLFDYFGGRDDLEAGRIVVLHNLSFIEDPTRILRAIRYESRYGLRMDEHTLNLARACCAMDLVGDLSSARLRDELVSLLDEEKVDFALRRAEELGVWPAIHGRLRVDAHTRALVRRADDAARGAPPRARDAALAPAPGVAAARPRPRGDRRLGGAHARARPGRRGARARAGGGPTGCSTASRVSRARPSCTTSPPASRWRPSWRR